MPTYEVLADPVTYRVAELPWVFGAFIEMNGCYCNTNGFDINTMMMISNDQSNVTLDLT